MGRQHPELSSSMLFLVFVSLDVIHSMLAPPSVASVFLDVTLLWQSISTLYSLHSTLYSLLSYHYKQQGPKTLLMHVSGPFALLCV